ncbi:LCP family protein [Ruminococcaceae bacterium OttesenSCG-928-D13]|nr:LCP family protein [Ruminococcaceae bacterium OttesenSCG-928-D13]
MDNQPRKPLYDYDRETSKGAGSGSGGVPPLNQPPKPDDGPEILAQARPRAQGQAGQGQPPRRPGGPVHTSKVTAERKRKKRRRRRIAVISISLVVLLLAGVAVWGLTMINNIGNTIRGEDTDGGIVPDTVKPANIPEYTGKNIVCGLILGIDYDNETADGYVDETNKVGNTDLIMYLMYNTKTDEANILQIPRDMFVGTEVETNGVGRVNALYRYSSDENNRVKPLAEALYDQLKLPVDFYITVDMDAVKAIVDHAQFIKIYVPHRVTDANTGNLLIAEGWQNITSQEIEYLVRNRNYAGNDMERQRVWQSVLSALFREFKRLSSSDLVMWMRILLHYVKVGGIDVWQVGGLAQEALNLTAEKLTFVQPPYWGCDYYPTKGPLAGIRQELVSLEPEETADILNQYFRPDGHMVPVEELNIQTLPVNQYGQGPAVIRSMKDVQDTEPEMPPS